MGEGGQKLCIFSYKSYIQKNTYTSENYNAMPIVPQQKYV